MAGDGDFSCSDDAFETEEREDVDVIHPVENYNDYEEQILFYRNFDSMSGRSLQRTKTRRRRWTQRDMTNAYNAVKYQGMSLRGAATAFNVPESTLRDRVHGRVSLECSRPGPPTFFTYEEEKKMVDHILFMSKIGYPYTRNQVVELAGDMTKAVGRIAPFKYLNPSQAWFYAFLNRWPDLKNFLFGPRSNRKSKGVSGDSIQSYFEQLEKVLNKYGIKDKPEHFWIVDEVSISCENQPPRILPISIQRAQSVSYWNPTVAMLGAANGVGDKIPPFLIYRGDSITSSMMEGSVRGTKFSYSTSGWVNSDAFIQWFLKHFRLLVVLRPLVLFYDGHLQFVSVRVLERAREDGVFLFPLPPHPAYNHCVENTCFWAFQGYFKKRLDRFFEQNPNQPMIRNNAAPVLTHAYEKALQPSNMISLFERLGICPFNNLSTSIGAYLNMTEDYDQLNLSNENADPYLMADNPTPPWSKLQSGPNYLHVPNLSNGGNVNAAVDDLSVITTNAVAARNISAAVEATEGSKLSISLPKFTLIPSSGSDSTASVQRTVLTQSTTSGRPVTIRLQGPAAGAIQPIHRAATSSDGVGGAPVAVGDESSALLTTTEGTCAVGDYENEIDISHEEEIGFDLLQQQRSQLVLASLASSSKSSNALRFSDSQSAGHVFVDEGAMMDDVREFCVVCGQMEPPELTDQSLDEQNNMDDLQVVDWAHCDYCNRWAHLNGSCSKDAVIGNDSFMCAVCHNDGAVGESLANSKIESSIVLNTLSGKNQVDCLQSLTTTV